MQDLPKGINMRCEDFLSELENIPVDGPATRELLAEVLEEARRHASECANCAEAVRVLAETREALAGMKAGQTEPGPWFVTRVMRAITAKEEEIEESRNSVWLGVRRLAPRMAAFAAVLLVLGGTWAMELRRTDRQTKQPEKNAVESLFETTPSAPVNDDIVASATEEPQQ